MAALQESSQEELRRIIDRLERLNGEIADLKADFADTIKNARQRGFDPKIIKKVLAIRKKDPSEVDEEQALLDTYLAALGMMAGDDTPLGRHWSDGDGEEVRA